MTGWNSPRSVKSLDALPKSGNGKVMWQPLQEARSK